MIGERLSLAMSKDVLLCSRIEQDKIVYERFKDIVKIPYGKFIDTYSTWDQDLHGRLAQRMKDAERYRYAIVRYGALGE